MGHAKGGSPRETSGPFEPSVLISLQMDRPTVACGRTWDNSGIELPLKPNFKTLPQGQIFEQVRRSQLADFLRVLTLRLDLLARTRPSAKRRTMAMFLAPWPLR